MNFRITEMQAAVVSAQLNKLDLIVKKIDNIRQF